MAELTTSKAPARWPTSTRATGGRGRGSLRWQPGEDTAFDLIAARAAAADIR